MGNKNLCEKKMYKVLLLTVVILATVVTTKSHRRRLDDHQFTVWPGVPVVYSDIVLNSFELVDKDGSIRKTMHVVYFAIDPNGLNTDHLAMKAVVEYKLNPAAEMMSFGC